MEFSHSAPLPNGWTMLSLESVCKKITSGGTPSRKYPEFYEGGTIPWVKTKELNDSWIYDTEEHITDKALNTSSAKLLPRNTILLAMYGATVAQLGILANKMACNQASCALIADEEKAHFRFLFYLLLEHRKVIKSLSVGAAQQNLSAKQIKQFSFGFPLFAEQRAIAHILGSLDNKIELNRQMAQTLESIARAIFKSWFVDFDPVKAKMEGKQPEGMTEEIAALFPDRLVDSELGMIPEGWSPIPLSKMANFLNGLALQKYPPIGKDDLPVLKIAQLRSGKLDYDKLASNEISDKYIVSEGDLIFSWSGSLIVDVWAGPKCALNQHLFKVTPEKWATKGLLWVAIHEHIDNFRAIAAAKAVTMGHIKRSHLNEAMVILPSIEKVQNISGVLDILIQGSTTLKAESNTLINLRDTLLPQLISGKIRVNQPEDAAA